MEENKKWNYLRNEIEWKCLLDKIKIIYSNFISAYRYDILSVHIFIGQSPIKECIYIYIYSQYIKSHLYEHDPSWSY